MGWTAAEHDEDSGCEATAVACVTRVRQRPYLPLPRGLLAYGVWDNH